MMNCEEVINKLYEFLDSELGQDDVSAIREHLEQCKPCFDHYQFDMLLKKVVKENLKKSKLSIVTKLKLYEQLKRK